LARRWRRKEERHRRCRRYVMCAHLGSTPRRLQSSWRTNSACAYRTKLLMVSFVPLLNFTRAGGRSRVCNSLNAALQQVAYTLKTTGVLKTWDKKKSVDDFECRFSVSSYRVPLFPGTLVNKIRFHLYAVISDCSALFQYGLSLRGIMAMPWKLAEKLFIQRIGIWLRAEKRCVAAASPSLLLPGGSIFLARLLWRAIIEY
jgi:hypothetical protein